ncbi:unnamed protein product, partial [marine sediment metagenome]
MSNSETTKKYGLVVIIAVIVFGGYYNYYQTTQPVPPTELQVYVDVGNREFIEEYVAPIMLEEHNVLLFVEGATASENLAKVVAEKDNPVASVVQSGIQAFYQARAIGLVQEISMEDVPYIEDYPDSVRDPNNEYIPVTTNFFGMFYHSEVF